MNILLGFFIIIIIIITIIDIYKELRFKEAGEQAIDSSNEVLKEDKKRILEYLKARKYQLIISLTFDRRKDLSIAEERTYIVYLKNEQEESGKASILIDHNGKIELVDFRIFDNYFGSKPTLRPKKYKELLAENTRYKSKVKEIQKIMRGL